MFTIDLHSARVEWMLMSVFYINSSVTPHISSVTLHIESYDVTNKQN